MKAISSTSTNKSQPAAVSSNTAALLWATLGWWYTRHTSCWTILVVTYHCCPDCPACLFWFVAGHNGCLNCFRDVQSHNPACPLCRKPFDPQQHLALNRELRDFIDMATSMFMDDVVRRSSFEAQQNDEREILALPCLSSTTTAHQMGKVVAVGSGTTGSLPAPEFSGLQCPTYLQDAVYSVMPSVCCIWGNCQLLRYHQWCVDARALCCCCCSADQE